MKIGLIGCGNIGLVVSKAVDEGKIPGAEIACVFDSHEKRAHKLASSLKNKPVAAGSVKDFTCFGVDFVVEAASQKAVEENILFLLDSGLSVLVMSVGALIDDSLMKKVLFSCRKTGARVYVPSGAVAGLDGVKSAACDGLEDVLLESIKPLSSLRDNDFLRKEGVDVESLGEKTLVFDGFAVDAVKYFPKSVNVCAALSLSGVGARKTKVKVFADPNADKINHRIHVKGVFGELSVEVSNIKSPDNPKTSYLACLSAIATLKKLNECVLIGT